MSVEEQFYEFGPFRLDVTERVLLRQGKPVQLTLKAFDTLLVLVERRGHIVEREELMKTVWPDSFVEEGNLTVTISVLRKVLEGGEDGHSYIETVPRRGYRFTAEVRQQRSNEGGPLEQVDRRLSAEGKDPVVSKGSRRGRRGPTEQPAEGTDKLAHAMGGGCSGCGRYWTSCCTDVSKGSASRPRD